jgi:hypothetical protein
LAPVTGTYSGTLTGNGNTISVAMSLTENTSQTSGNMGRVTGTISIGGSPCFNSNAPLTISEGSHLGEEIQLSTAPDVNGQSVGINTIGIGVDPNTAAITLNPASSGSFGISGGACNGQVFTGTLTQ